MSKSPAILFVVSFSLLHLFCTASRARASSVNLSFLVDQFGSSTGDPSYDVQLTGLGSVAQSVTLPNGSVYTINQIVFSPPTFNSFSALSTGIFGTWTFLEASSGARYRFTVSPFTLSDVFSETPEITSPQDGAAVDSTFDVFWNYPSGAHPTGRGYSLNGAQLTSTYLASQEIEFQNISSTPATTTIRIDNQSSITSHLGSVTAVGSPGLNSYSFFGNLLFFNDESAPITVTAAPEPTSFVLAAMAGMGLIVWRYQLRRNKKPRHPARAFVNEY